MKEEIEKWAEFIKETKGIDVELAEYYSGLIELGTRFNNETQGKNRYCLLQGNSIRRVKN